MVATSERDIPVSIRCSVNQPSPAIVPQSAVRRLPRWALLLLCLAYIAPGFVGRDPWRGADMTALGYMLELAQGHTPWLSPLLGDLPPETDGLLPYWLGAWAMQFASPWLAPEWAARIPFVLLLALTLQATWYGIHDLARSPGAQPVAFAFGGEAAPADYARAMADGGLLALLACLGLAQPSHETTSYLVQLCCTSLIFYGLAASPHQRAWPLLALAAGLPGLVLSGAPTLALLYGLVFKIIGSIFSVYWQSNALQNLESNMQEMPAAWREAFRMVLENPIIASPETQLFIAPFIGIFLLFFNSMLFHVAMMITGAAKNGYETTFRVVAYAESSAIFYAIPMVGGTIAVVYWLVLIIIGNREAHRAPGGQVIAAVLLPLFLCLCLFSISLFTFASALIGPSN